MSPRLFTASDVERAARLAAQSAASGDPIEPSVAFALDVVAGESPPYYSEEDVLHILQFVLEKEDVMAEFEDAVATALRR